MPASVDEVYARLQGPALGALVALVVDHLLEQPLDALVDPDRTAGQIVRALDTATRSEQSEAWLRERIAELRTQVPAGRVGDQAPPEVVAPLREVLARPYQPDRVLVGRFMDHAAMRELIKGVMRSSLHGFVQKVKDLQQSVPVPPSVQRRSSSSFSRLRALSDGVRAVSEGVVGQVSKEFEQRMSSKVGEFVDEALAQAMSQIADHLCDPEHAGKWGDYRAFVLDELLSLENQQVAAEIDKLDPDNLVAVGAATGRALARRDGFADDLSSLIRTAIDATEGRTLRDFLKETGLEDAEAEWREDLEAQVAEQAQAVVATDAFRSWLDDLMR